jgi:hypothetical protein
LKQLLLFDLDPDLICATSVVNQPKLAYTGVKYPTVLQREARWPLYQAGVLMGGTTMNVRAWAVFFSPE